MCNKKQKTICNIQKRISYILFCLLYGVKNIKKWLSDVVIRYFKHLLRDFRIIKLNINVEYICKTLY